MPAVSSRRAYHNCAAPVRCIAAYHTRLVLHHKIEAEELAHPMVLRNHRQALVEDEPQAPMVCANQKTAPPQIRPLMPHYLDEADELPLVCGQLSVAWCDRLAVERH
jgi:hypothetical protein